MKLSQARAAIATIRHDLKVGNVEHARRVAKELLDMDGVHEATPAQLQTAIASIEVKLEECGL